MSRRKGETSEEFDKKCDEETYRLPKPHRRRVSAYLTSANSRGGQHFSVSYRLTARNIRGQIQDVMHKPSVSNVKVILASLSQAKQCVTKFNGGGVNTHILTNVVEKATEVAKTPKKFVSCHKKCKHRGMRRIKEQRKKRCVGKLTNYHRGRN